MSSTHRPAFDPDNARHPNYIGKCAFRANPAALPNRFTDWIGRPHYAPEGAVERRSSVPRATGDWTRSTLPPHIWFNHSLSYGPQFRVAIGRLHRPRFGMAPLRRHPDIAAPGVSVDTLALPSHWHRLTHSTYCDPHWAIAWGRKPGSTAYPNRNFPIQRRIGSARPSGPCLPKHRAWLCSSSYNDCRRNPRNGVATFLGRAHPGWTSPWAGRNPGRQEPERDGNTHVKPIPSFVIGDHLSSSRTRPCPSTRATAPSTRGCRLTSRSTICPVATGRRT